MYNVQDLWFELRCVIVYEANKGHSTDEKLPLSLPCKTLTILNVSFLLIYSLKQVRNPQQLTGKTAKKLAT
jgi:hypothetical protein